VKRLIKKLSSVVLDPLDEADVKNDRCPNCKNQKLNRSDGFKYCTTCGHAYKMFDGKAYLVLQHKQEME
jgi:ribosomal protein L37AE/L43A